MLKLGIRILGLYAGLSGGLLLGAPTEVPQEASEDKEASQVIVENNDLEGDSIDLKKAAENLAKNSPFIPAHFSQEEPETNPNLVQTPTNYELHSVIKKNQGTYIFGLTDTTTKKGFLLSSEVSMDDSNTPVHFLDYNEAQKLLILRSTLGERINLRLQSNKKDTSKGSFNSNFNDFLGDETENSLEDKD